MNNNNFIFLGEFMKPQGGGGNAPSSPQQDGYFVSKRNLWLAAYGGIGVLAVSGLAKLIAEKSPIIVGAIREGYSFFEWAGSSFEQTKENIEDTVAEAKHSHHTEMDTKEENSLKEKELIQKIKNKISTK
ncbi:MAG: hypothetical protein ACI86H_000181 [bacterium]